ncbi:MAG: thioesterase family protein [Sedimenticola sp.]
MQSDDKQTLALSDYPFQTFDKVRYADTDQQEHVNNALFSTYLETGRVEFLYDPKNRLISENSTFVIASLNLQFISEINWPGRIDIGTGVTKVGNSSLCLYQGMFQEDLCVATAETVIVQMHEETRKSHPLSKKTRDFLLKHLIV